MNEPFAWCTVALVVVTCVSSLVGFARPDFCQRHLFSIPEILADKQYSRLITHAFLHADLTHLGMNMLTLYLFGRNIELWYGCGYLLAIYFAAVIGGGLLALWLHRQHEYQAYGASGGVCGVVFGHIFLLPGGGIMMLPLPVMIPSWLYAILFLAGSFFALKKQRDHIGHDAHLGGAIIGLLTTVALKPSVVRMQPVLFAVVAGISVLLFVYFLRNPMFLPLEGFLPGWAGRRKSKLPRHKWETRNVDAVLEKISKHGVESLTAEERALLESVSGKYRRWGDSKKPESDLII